MSRQICAIGWSEPRINLTVSVLNSLVKVRLERSSIPVDAIGGSILRSKVPAELGQLHHRWVATVQTLLPRYPRRFEGPSLAGVRPKQLGLDSRPSRQPPTDHLLDHGAIGVRPVWLG
jgi:hypothetical protein